MVRTNAVAFVKLIVTGFYCGLVPKASGTIGTVLAIPLVILLGQFSSVIYLSFTLVFIIVSIVLIEIYEANVGTKDHSSIVIDEMAGYLVAMAMLPQNLTYVFLSFVIFRLLDITKPLPIRYLDRSVKGSTGVVLDDVAAGLFTNIFLQILHQLT